MRHSIQYRAATMERLCIAPIATVFAEKKVYYENFGYTYIYMITLTDDHVVVLYHGDRDSDNYVMVALEGKMSDGVLYITHAAAKNAKGACSIAEAIADDSYLVECIDIVFKVSCDFTKSSNVIVPDWHMFHDNFMDLAKDGKRKELYYISQLRGEDLLM